MLNLSDPVWEVIVMIMGIMGTLLGTFMGWWLTSAGRINILFSKCKVDFEIGIANPYDKTLPIWKQSPAEVIVEMEVLIHNSKGVPLSLLNCDILLEYQDEKVLINNCIFNTQGDICKFNEFINIGAHSVVTVQYKKHYPLLPHPEKLKTGYKLYFICKVNGKKRIKKKICQENPT